MKTLFKSFYLIIITFAFFTADVSGSGNYPNIASGDSTMSFKRNNVITFNPPQLLAGELRLSLERQVSEKKYNIFGIGAIYYGRNGAEAREAKGYQGYGGKIFFGKKFMKTAHKYLSYIIFAKYEHDDNITLGPKIYDRYSDYSYDHFVALYRDKIVLGTKFILGEQNSQNNKMIYSFYIGAGIRFKYFDYPASVDRSGLSYIDKGYVIPSVHLGYKIGYNTKKIKECE